MRGRSVVLGPLRTTTILIARDHLTRRRGAPEPLPSNDALRLVVARGGQYTPELERAIA